jgi:hypothetical protein
LRNATATTPWIGAGAVVDGRGEMVVLEEVGGTEVAGAVSAVERPAGEVTTDAIPAPAARTSSVVTAIHERALPGTRIPTSRRLPSPSFTSERRVALTR